MNIRVFPLSIGSEKVTGSPVATPAVVVIAILSIYLP